MSIPDTLPFFTPKYIQIPSSTNNHHPFLNRFPQQNQKQWVFFKNHPFKQIPPKTKMPTTQWNCYIKPTFWLFLYGKICRLNSCPVSSHWFDLNGSARCIILPRGRGPLQGHDLGNGGFKNPLGDKSWGISTIPTSTGLPGFLVAINYVW